MFKAYGKETTDKLEQNVYKNENKLKDIPYSLMRRFNIDKISNFHKFSFILTMPIKTLTGLLSEISQNGFNIRIGEQAN